MANAFLSTESWQQVVARTLPLFGHRNWIVVADSAFPQSSRSGTRTIVADTDQAHAVQTVLSGIEESWHLRPKIYLDSELDLLTDEDASGIEKYRDWLTEKLKAFPVEWQPHEKIIATMSSVAEQFQVLVLKSHMQLPYTSVFIELHCGYWDGKAEEKLRRKMASAERVV